MRILLQLSRGWCTVVLQGQADVLLGQLLKLLEVFAVHLGGVDVGRAVDVGLGQHAHHGQEDLFHTLETYPDGNTSVSIATWA